MHILVMLFTAKITLRKKNKSKIKQLQNRPLAHSQNKTIFNGLSINKIFDMKKCLRYTNNIQIHSKYK